MNPLRGATRPRTSRTARRRALTAVAALTAGTLLAACGGGDADDDDGATPTPGGDGTTTSAPAELTEVDLILNFIAGGPNSGFMLAAERGYYEEVGLKVNIQEGQGSATTASLISNGNAEFGYADGPAVMQVTSQGGELLIHAPILQTNGFSVMFLNESGITGIEDLVGRSVGVQPGTAQASLFDAVLAANDVNREDVDIVNVDPSALVGSLLEGRVDAITAGADSQGVQLADQGADFSQVFYRDGGVPTVGLSIFTQAAYAQENPEIVQAFVEASLRGWDDARKEPEAAAAAVASFFPDAGTEEAFVKQLAVDVELLCAPGAATLGNLPEEHWAATFDLLTTYLGLPTDNPVESYFTTDNLPEDAPTC